MRRAALESERLEAFSDGVIAVIITIMVLELKRPDGYDWSSLLKVWPSFAAYALSFAYVGIYWNNHHHLLRAAKGINGAAMWANLHLLFWLSLIPFTTAWLNGNLDKTVPTAAYGIVLLLSALAYTILTFTLMAAGGYDSILTQALGIDLKQVASLILYVAGVVAAFFIPWLADAFYVAVAFLWFVPDRRLERALAQKRTGAG